VTERQGGLRFDIYERVHLSDELAAIKELDEIELLPQIQVRTEGDQAVLKGNLWLTGKYVGEEDDSLLSLEHFIPVEITLPMNRVHRMEDVAVEIENFDFDLLSSRTMNVTGVLSLAGIELTTTESNGWREEEEVVFVHEAAQNNDFSPDEMSDPRSAQETRGTETPEWEWEPHSTQDSRGMESPVWEPPTVQEPRGMETPSWEPRSVQEPRGIETPSWEPYTVQEPRGFETPSWEQRPVQEAARGIETPAWEQYSVQEPRSIETPAREQQTGLEAHGTEALEPEREEEPAELQQSEQEEFVQEASSPTAAAVSNLDESTYTAEQSRPPEPAVAQQEAEEEKKEMKIAFTGKPAGEFEHLHHLKSIAVKSETRNVSQGNAAADAAASTDHTRESIEWKKLLGASSNETQFRRLRMCIVQKEETVESIADRYQINPREIVLYNRLGSQPLAEGQVIYIP